MQGYVAISAPSREMVDAHLFAQLSTLRIRQTDDLIFFHCACDLASTRRLLDCHWPAACAPLTQGFHEVFAGPRAGAQSDRSGDLPYRVQRSSLRGVPTQATGWPFTIGGVATT